MRVIRNCLESLRCLLLIIHQYFFDFAYLKKPVIYYHATDDHYTEGYFDYRTMGFGEVIESENDLIKIIKEYIDCDCKMKRSMTIVWKNSSESIMIKTIVKSI